MARHPEVVERLPVGERLAGMVDRRFEIDHRFRRQGGERPEARVGEIGGEIGPRGEGAHAEHVGVAGEDRNRLAHVLRGLAVHDDARRAVSSFQDEPPGVTTKLVAAELRHRRLHRGEGAQRRVEEQQPEDLAGERLGVAHCSRGAPPARGDRRSPRAAAPRGSASCFIIRRCLPGPRRGERHARGRASAAAAGGRRTDRRWCRRGCRARGARPGSPSPADACAGRGAAPRPWTVDHRSAPGEAEERPRDDPDARHEPLLDDRAESGFDRRADQRSAAEGRAEVAGGERRQRIGPDDQRGGRQAAGEPLADRQDVGRHAVQARRERGAAAPEAALHFVEDQQRAGPRRWPRAPRAGSRGPSA